MADSYQAFVVKPKKVNGGATTYYHSMNILLKLCKKELINISLNPQATQNSKKQTASRIDPKIRRMQFL